MKTRFPLEPLVEALQYRTAADGQPIGKRKQSLAVYLGVDSRQIYRWYETGILDRQAETLAFRVGVMPEDVWSTWFDAVTLECDSRDCDVRFVPRNPRHRFCSARCRYAETQRRARELPEVAERNRQRRRAYYAENGEYERARQRRYDQEVRDRRRQSRAA